MDWGRWPSTVHIEAILPPCIPRRLGERELTIITITITITIIIISITIIHITLNIEVSNISSERKAHET